MNPPKNLADREWNAANAENASPDVAPGVALGRTIGARSLVEVDDTIAGVARTIGASKSTVWAWRAGTKTPGRESRERLHEAYGIELAAWDRLAEPATVVEERPTAVALGTLRREQVRRASTLEACLDVLDQIDRDMTLAGLLPREVQQFRAAKLAALTLRARLEERIELRDDATVWEHPSFRRILGAALRLIDAPGFDADAARALRAGLADAGVPGELLEPRTDDDRGHDGARV